MTKRDSAHTGIDSPRGPMSLQRRQLTVSVQHSRAVASSDHHPTGDQSQASSNQHHSGTTELGDTPSSAPHFGYTSDIPPVPMPSGSQWYPQGEAYPLQSEIQKQNKVLHTHIFKKIVSPPGSNTPDRLVVTEVDRQGEERNRQPEYFFNGIVGHVRAENGGYIDSWQQATRLANYWRRFYGIPVPVDNYQHWHQPWQPSDNVDQTSEYQDSPHESVMDDNTSNAANVGALPVPSRIHQLASILYNILSNDREANAAILEKIETDQTDLATDPCQIFTAEDLAHLASHLATTTQTLSQHALRMQMEALSDIENWHHERRLSLLANSSTHFPVFWSHCNFLLQETDNSSSPLVTSIKKPRGSGACVWNIWKDVKLLSW